MQVSDVQTRKVATAVISGKLSTGTLYLAAGYSSAKECLLYTYLS